MTILTLQLSIRYMLVPADIERDLLKTWSRASINENIPAASVHVVEQPDVRNTIVDLVIRRVRWRRRIRQSLLPVQERQGRSDAWFRSPLGYLQRYCRSLFDSAGLAR